MRPLTPAQLEIKKANDKIDRERLEADFVDQLREERITGWVRQHVFHPTRKWALDIAIPELLVAAEVHGGTFKKRGRHVTGKGFGGDRVKMNEAQLAGWIVIEGDVEMLRKRVLINQLIRAIELRRNGACPR